MHISVPVVALEMATEASESSVYGLKTEVSSSTSSSIYIKWAWEGFSELDIVGFRVRHQRVSSNYEQVSKMLPSSATEYSINNLVADTYYRVCVTLLRNESSAAVAAAAANPLSCVDASTTSWHIPVSIGSSIGAVLALSIIVLIVLLSRCPALVRQTNTAAPESSKFDSMTSSHYYADDHGEMSDTTTHYHDRDDDGFSQHSEGEACLIHKSHGHNSPKSLADHMCNGSRLLNGMGRPMRVGACGRTFSFTDRRHHPHHHLHRARQARLAHIHANFHSIQSEPGSVPTRATTSYTGEPTVSASNSDSSTNMNKPNTSSNTAINGKGILNCTGCSSKPAGFRDMPRLPYKFDTETSSSAPVVSKAGSDNPSPRPAALKHIPKTFHMSIEGDTLV